MCPQEKKSQPNFDQQPKIESRFETIKLLLSHLENYKPVYVGSKEADRLHHYRDIICEDLTIIVESIIHGEYYVHAD